MANKLKIEKHICDICGKEYTGFGNNAEPVYSGRCCDKCNRLVVIPARILEFTQNNTNNDER